MGQAPLERQPAPPRHLKHVEGLRALACLVVFVNHAYAQVTQIEGHQYPSTGILSLFPYSMVTGHLSVTVFITVSGFCLTLPVAKNGDRLRGGTKDFFRRRARRILPAYYGAVALCLALIWTVIGKPTGTLWDFPAEVSRFAIVSHLLLMQDLFATSRICYVFWSIAVEWHIYFLFPLLVWAWRRWGPSGTVITALLGGYALRILFSATRLTRANPQYIGIFALGMLAAYLTQVPSERYARLRDRVPWGVILGVSTVAAIVLMVWIGIPRSVPNFYILDLPVGIMTMSALVLSSKPQAGLLTRVLSWRPLVFVGTFSYSVYLVHAPLLQVFWQYGLRPAGLKDDTMFVLTMTVGLALILAVAYVFFLVFEQPFIGSAAKKSRPAAGSPETVVPVSLPRP